MITQRKSSLHTRDREIAAMPLAVDDVWSVRQMVIATVTWVAMAAVLGVTALIFA